MIVDEQFDLKYNDWSNFKKLIKRREIFVGDLLESLIQKHARSKKARNNSAFRQEFQLESEFQFNNFDCKYIGATIAESKYNLLFAYTGELDESHAFGGMSFEPDGDYKLVVTQLQGLTSVEHKTNYKDLKLNIELLSHFKWDRVLLEYLVEIGKELHLDSIRVVGARNQRWLRATHDVLKYHYCPHLFSAGEGSFDEFLEFSDEEMDEIVYGYVFPFNGIKNIHMYPQRAFKRYDECALEVGFKPLKDDKGKFTNDYIYSFSERKR